jgi:hypothetical protein
MKQHKFKRDSIKTVLKILDNQLNWLIQEGHAELVLLKAQQILAINQQVIDEMVNGPKDVG